MEETQASIKEETGNTAPITYTPPVISLSLITTLYCVAVVSIGFGMAFAIYTSSGAPKYAFSAEDSALNSAIYWSAANQFVGGLMMGLILITLGSICAGINKIGSRLTKTD